MNALEWCRSDTDADNWRLYGVLDNRLGCSSADDGFSEHEDVDCGRTDGFASAVAEEANLEAEK